MFVSNPTSPGNLYEKAEQLLGAQLGQMMRPLFQPFEEEGLFGTSQYASFVTYMLSQEMGNILAESPTFEPLVQELSDSLIKVQESSQKLEV